MTDDLTSLANHGPSWRRAILREALTDALARHWRREAQRWAERGKPEEAAACRARAALFYWGDDPEVEALLEDVLPHE